MNLEEKIVNEIIDISHKHDNIKIVVLFGSRASWKRGDCYLWEVLILKYLRGTHKDFLINLVLNKIYLGYNI